MDSWNQYNGGYQMPPQGFNCPNCGAMNMVGNARCGFCRIDFWGKKALKKKESTMGLTSMIMSICSWVLLLIIPVIATNLIYAVAITATILAIIDLATNDKKFDHVCAWTGLVLSVGYMIIAPMIIKWYIGEVFRRAFGG